MTDPTADAAKLLPCPFCGGDGEKYAWDGNGIVIGVCCRPCGIYMQTFADDAVHKWNMRPQPAPPEGEPDFQRIAKETIQDWDIAPRVSQVAEFGERMYHLGRAAQPKVEDAPDER